MAEPEQPQPESDKPGFGGAFLRWLLHIGLLVVVTAVGHAIFGGRAPSEGMLLFYIGLAIVGSLIAALVRPRGPGHGRE
jgi:hypothetical protein